MRPRCTRSFSTPAAKGCSTCRIGREDYQALYDRALSLGYKVGHEGQIGGEQGRFAYFDTQSHPGTVIEISDISGAKGAFFDRVRQAAANWDGSRPIREVGGR